MDRSIPAHYPTGAARFDAAWQPGRVPFAPPPREEQPLAAIVTTLIAGALPAIVLGVVAARGGASNPWVIPLALVTFLVDALIILMDLRYGLALFIVAAALSPKLPGLYNNLRLEDFIFALVFGAWLLQGIAAGRLPPVQSAIIMPFVLLTLMSIVSTMCGWTLGAVPDWKYSFFLQAKRVEYFLIFWVVATSVRDEAWLKALAVLFVASGALAAIYGMATPTTDPTLVVGKTRVNGPEGENYNTLSGYLVLCIAAGLAVIPAFPRVGTRIFLILCTAVAAAGLLLSFSREGYIMLFGSLLFFGFTQRRGIMLGAIVALLVVLTMSGALREHVNDTVGVIREAQSGEADIGGNSLAARYAAWGFAWEDTFIRRPALGSGVGSVNLSLDNEYLMRLCEVGLVGFGIFLWWLTAIGQQVKELLRQQDRFVGLLAAGLGAGFVGLLIQGIVAASFSTIRTMEPFWFFLGLVTAGSLLHPRAALAETPEVTAPPDLTPVWRHRGIPPRRPAREAPGPAAE